MLRGLNVGTLVVVARMLLDLLDHERPLLSRGEIVVGVDEVGRGSLAGPMSVGAVVVMRDSLPPEGLTDSKLLTPTQREALEEPLKLWAADWAIGSVSPKEIDKWGLRLALAVAASRALEGLHVHPTFALLDGSFNLLRAPLELQFGVESPPSLSYADLPCTTLVKGDQRSATIAAASVLAKVWRDRAMVALHEGFEVYGWAQNKGYGAPVHLEALRDFGPSVHHRQSWHLPVHVPTS